MSHVYYSVGSSQSRRVVILINKKLQFKCIKQIKDTIGRVLILVAEIQGHTIILTNIYAPNRDETQFFADLEVKLQQAGDYNGIIGGDFNLVMDPILDRSGTNPIRMSRASLAVRRMAESLGYIDVWRILNPKGRDYSFFSPPHSTFSRIDLFLISRGFLQSVISCSIGSILVSDHALVNLEVLPFSDRIRMPRWRFNSSLLQESEFKEALRNQIKEYLELNEPTAPSAGIAWEALKAVLRGFVIQQASYKKKLRSAK